MFGSLFLRVPIHFFCYWLLGFDRDREILLLLASSLATLTSVECSRLSQLSGRIFIYLVIYLLSKCLTLTLQP